MRFISFLFKRILTAAIILSLSIAAILYLRKDIHWQDFINNPKYWIVPLAVFYLVLNFERIVSSFISKILFFGMLIWAGYTFYPGMMKHVEPYVGQYVKNINTDNAIHTVNGWLTPSDGSKPVLQFDNGKNPKPVEKKKPQVDQEEQKPTNSISHIDFKNMSKEDAQKTVQQFTPNQIEDLAGLPLSQLSDVTKLAPIEMQNKLYQMGFKAENPVATLQQIVGNNRQNKEQALNNFFK